MGSLAPIRLPESAVAVGLLRGGTVKCVDRAPMMYLIAEDLEKFSLLIFIAVSVRNNVIQQFHRNTYKS